MRSVPSQYIDRASTAFRIALRVILADGTPTERPEVVGKRAAVQAAAGFIWSNHIGPFTDVDGAMSALGDISRQALHERLSTPSVLGLRLQNQTRTTFVFPVWQFMDPLLSNLGEILRASGYSRDDPVSGWIIASWMKTPDDRFKGLTPVELVEAGRLDETLQLAHALGAGLRA